MVRWSTRPNERKDSIKMSWSGPSINIWRGRAIQNTCSKLTTKLTLVDTLNLLYIFLSLSLLLTLPCCCGWSVYFYNVWGHSEKVSLNNVPLIKPEVSSLEELIQHFLFLQWKKWSESHLKLAPTSKSNMIVIAIWTCAINTLQKACLKSNE